VASVPREAKQLLMPPAGAMPPGPNEMEEDDLFK